MTGTGAEVRLRGKIELDDEFVSNILITAFDGNHGGSWYWAAPAHADWLEAKTDDSGFPAKWTKCVIVDKEEDDGPQHPVTATSIALGLTKMIEMGDEWARDAFGWISDQENADIDANDADCIVQFGIFGSVVYG